MPISINENSDYKLELTKQDKMFVDKINNRITGYGQIPYTIPTPLIVDVIMDSARLFFKYHWKATHKLFYRLSYKDIIDFTGINEETNIIAYLVQLPSFVNVVYNIFETNKISQGIEFGRQIENIGSSITSGSNRAQMRGIDQALYLIDAACRMTLEQNYQSVFGTTIPYNYNQLTNQLSINKKIDKDLVLECLCNINIQHLYIDDLFVRHVIGCTKRELKRLIASHTIQLPGDTTLNADEICNNLEDIEKVEEILKGAGGLGDIIMTND
jgi:hypothetical protein